MLIFFGIVALIVAMYLHNQLNKVKHDRMIMEQFGITNLRETTYLINRFGRGNVSISAMIIYMAEKEAGMHPQFKYK